jgi:hypothetical protein
MASKAQAKQDMLDEASALLSGGPADTIVSAPADMHDEAVARLRPDTIAEQLTLGPKPGNAKGYQLDVPDWNAGKAIANGMAQGLLPEIIGQLKGNAADTSRRIGWPSREEALAGGISPVWQNAYTEGLQGAKDARAAYERENPGKALTGEMVGSMATAIPAMAAGAGALAPLGRAASAAAPWLSSVVDFFSGASRGVARLPSLAARGVAEGAGSAALTSGLSDKPLGEQMQTGAVVGGALGPVAGKVADTFGSHVTGTAADTAQALLDQGVAVRAGQVPGSNKVAQGLDKVFGGGNAEQREQFATQLTGHAGLPEKEVSQGWVAKNDARIGKTMNDIQSVYSIPQLEPGLLHDLSTVRSNAISNMSVENAQKVSDFVRKIEDNTFSDMNGATYKNITQKGGILDNMSKDKDIASAVPQIREALDDAWGRALPADKKAAWDQARKEYKVTRVIDDSMGPSGASEGVYNPKKLLKAVEDRYGNVENAGDLGMLARGGQFLEPPGVAPASAKHSAVKTIGGLALAGAAGAAASEGSHVITHWGPQAIAALSQHPETMALPLSLAAGIYGAGKGANAAFNGPRATQYLLDVSRGSRQPMLHGINPLLPFGVEAYNKQ